MTELLLVICLSMLLLSFAIPRHRNSEALTAKAYLQQLKLFIQQTQLKAIQTQETWILCPLPDKGSKEICGQSWQNGCQQLPKRTMITQHTLSGPPMPMVLTYQGFPRSNQVSISGIGLLQNSNGTFQLRKAQQTIARLRLNQMGGLAVELTNSTT